MCAARRCLTAAQAFDIGVRDGTIAAVEPKLDATATTEIDATGKLVTPPFVDAHFHMDTTLTYGYPRYNRSGTLLEGIALWGELRPELTFEWNVERALEYCSWAIAQGLLAIRSHVDITDPALVGVEALLHVREKVKESPRHPACRLPARRLSAPARLC